jgi:raffinose/stachyose/melibiose transport system substrate-binding protein
MTVIKTLRGKGVTPFALCNKVPTTWQGGLYIGMLGYRLGGKQLFYDLSSGAAKFSDPTMVQAAQYMSDMVAAGAFPEDANNLTVDQARQTFMTGQAAMWFMLSSEISNLTAEVQKNGTPNPVFGKVDFFNWPAVENGKTDDRAWILSPDYGIAISNGSKNKKAAAEFIKLLLSEKYQGLFASISDSPSVNGVKFDTSKANPLFLKLLDGLSNTSDSVTFPDRILGQQTLGGELNLATQPLVARENPKTVMQNLENRAKDLRAQ